MDGLLDDADPQVVIAGTIGERRMLELQALRRLHGT